MPVPECSDDIRKMQLPVKRSSIVHFADGGMPDFGDEDLSRGERNWARLAALSNLDSGARHLEEERQAAGQENREREYTRWQAREEERRQRELKKNLANKIFGYLARREFWLKLGW